MLPNDLSPKISEAVAGFRAFIAPYAMPMTTHAMYKLERLDHNVTRRKEKAIKIQAPARNHGREMRPLLRFTPRSERNPESSRPAQLDTEIRVTKMSSSPLRVPRQHHSEQSTQPSPHSATPVKGCLGTAQQNSRCKREGTYLELLQRSGKCY